MKVLSYGNIRMEKFLLYEKIFKKNTKKIAKNQFFVIFEGENLSKIKKSWVVLKDIFKAFLMPFSECQNSFWLKSY